jgi:hypothetical protein
VTLRSEGVEQQRRACVASEPGEAVREAGLTRRPAPVTLGVLTAWRLTMLLALPVVVGIFALSGCAVGGSTRTVTVTRNVGGSAPANSATTPAPSSSVPTQDQSSALNAAIARRLQPMLPSTETITAVQCSQSPSKPLFYDCLVYTTDTTDEFYVTLLSGSKFRAAPNPQNVFAHGFTGTY